MSLKSSSKQSQPQSPSTQGETSTGKWDKVNAYKRRQRALKRHFVHYPNDIDLKFFKFTEETYPENRCHLQTETVDDTTIKNTTTSENRASRSSITSTNTSSNHKDSVTVQRVNIDETRAAKCLKHNKGDASNVIQPSTDANNLQLENANNVEECNSISIDNGNYQQKENEINEYLSTDDYEGYTEVADNYFNERSQKKTPFGDDINSNSDVTDDGANKDSSDDNGDDDYDSGDDTDKNGGDMAFSIKNKLHELSVPIRFNGQISNLFVLLIFLATAIRSRLTYTALINSFRAFKKTVLESRLPSTKNSLWKLLSRSDNAAFTRHWYCAKCFSNIGSGPKPTACCECLRCGPTKEKKHLAYFIQLKIKTQLEQLFEIPGIGQCFAYRFTRRKHQANNMEDIYDSKKYRELCELGRFLSYEYNYSFSLFTDGVNVSNSSNASAWPIMLMINEFSPNIRKKYMILAGIWVDKKHPNLHHLLEPTVNELKLLYRDGIVWNNPINDNMETTSKFVTVVCTADSKARAPLLSMTQGNGIYGCTYCYHKGEKRDGPGVVRVYSYEKIPSKRRTDAEIRTHMGMAYDTGEKIFGVQNYSVLAMLDEFDLACSAPVDSMHNMYLGVARFHMNLLINGKASDPWYVGSPRDIATINRRLMDVRPPSRISRKPRPIEEMGHWKASEWRNWLQFYALHCLHGLIRERYYKHLALLSQSAYILNQASVSAEELQTARTMLTNYVKEFNEIFGKRNMRYNVHLLNHVADSVEEWGPLWTHSAFPYEGYNKKIIDKVTSSNSRCLQIATRHLLARFMGSVLHHPEITYDMREAVNDLLTDGMRKKKNLIDNEHYIKPKAFECKDRIEHRPLVDKELKVLAVAGLANPRPETLSIYRHVIVKGAMNFSCELTEKSKKTRYCDKFIYCETIGYAAIKKVVTFHYSDDSTISGFIIERLIKTNNYYGDIQHIHCVKKGPHEFLVCDEKTTIVPAILLGRIKQRFIISKLPNTWETD